jgi:hypothetical protein
MIEQTATETAAAKVKDIVMDLKADWLTEHLTELLANGNQPDKEPLVINHLKSLKTPQKREQVMLQVGDTCDASTPYNCNGQCQAYPCLEVQ